MQRIRVLVADDHRIFAESLAAALAAEQDIEVGAVGSVPAALRSLARGAADARSFDVLLVDADLATGGPPEAAGPAESAAGAGPSGPAESAVPSPSPPSAAGVGAPVPPLQGAPVLLDGPQVHGNGLPFLARLRAECPGLRVVLLAEREDARLAASALQSGAGGWVAKDCSLSSLLRIVRGVLKGETHVSPALLTGVLRELTAAREHRTESERLVGSLTPREREVLRCMVAGLGRKAVAERLCLSPHTVRTHMQNVLGKLDVHSTLAAVALARRAGVGPAELDSGGAG